MASAGLSGDHLAAALAAVAKMPPGGQSQGQPSSDPSATTTGVASDASGQSAPAPAGGDPSAGGADQGAQGSPTEQAVWTEFPSTDPTQVQQLAQQVNSASPDQLVQLLASWMQQAQSDQEKMSQMQDAMLAHLTDLLGAAGPTQGGTPPGGGQMPPQGPGVGGAGSGY